MKKKNKNKTPPVVPTPKDLQVQPESSLLTDTSDNLEETDLEEEDNKLEEDLEDETDNDVLVRAVFLLKEAQKGMNVLIRGAGPFEDISSGIFYQTHADQFFISQWDEELSKLLKEIGE